jgi:hypothetical protein
MLSSFCFYNPFIETVRTENQRLHRELGNCVSEKELFK